jgi:putative NIF3 family GTP cyclohydrolase 1 type 2
LEFAEDFDNVGLLVGNKKNNISKVLISHDCIESVVDEAIKLKCELIICFHPIIYSGLKKINTNTYVRRTVTKALKNDINIYAIHTSLDNNINGVNKSLADELGLKNREVLIPKKKYNIKVKHIRAKLPFVYC